MREWLHAVWPFLAVSAFTAFLALQIPRKALFFEPTAQGRQSAAFASFVAFDDATQERIVRETRMSWQVRSARLTGHEGPTVQLGLEDPLPPHAAMPLPSSFAAAFAGEETVPDAPRPLMPPTHASPIVFLPQEPDPVEAASVDAVRKDLLTVPDSLVDFGF